MSDNVVVTVKYPEGNNPHDLELPTRIQVSILAPLILKALEKYGWPSPVTKLDQLIEYHLKIEDSDYLVEPSQTLEEAGVLNGDILTLLPRLVPKPQPITGPALVSIQGRVFPLIGNEIFVGRDPQSISKPLGIDLTGFPKELSVSRLHAQITIQNNVYVVKDLESMNGTRINGDRIVGLKPLAHGDRVAFGDVILLFQLPGMKSEILASLVTSNGASFRLSKSLITIGRADPPNWTPDIDLTKLDQDNVASRQHAEILKDNQHFLVRAQPATNGTFLNGREIPPNENILLNHEDSIQFGYLGVSLIFRLPTG